MKNLAFLILFLASPIFAEVPTLKLPVEISGEPGTFIAVRAESSAAWVNFRASPGLAVFPADLLSDRKATVLTAARPGKYKLFCYTGNEDGGADAEIVVVILGVPPGPGPDPEPNPNPTPTPTGPLAKQMATWLAPLKGKVTKDHLNKLADNYGAIAAEAVAIQGVMTRDGFIAATQSQNTLALGPELALAMRDPFFKPLAVYLAGKNLKVDDEAGHAALWREVSAALTEVAKGW